MSRKYHRKTLAVVPLDQPLRERTWHDSVERSPQQVADAAGLIGRPYRVVDTLALMERRGTISRDMRIAGERFRDDFTVARLDPLRGMDPGRLRLASRGPWRGLPAGYRVAAARERVWLQLHILGGLASPGGSCLWHVLGWGQSLNEWASQQGWAGRRVSREAAGGIMVAALGALAEQVRGPRSGGGKKNRGAANFPLALPGKMP